MIDYPEIGTRIRAARIAKGLTQEQLAAAIQVGTTHISHIETGNTIPSMKTFVAIVNTLDCSADELLCRELTQARPIFTSWLSEQVADCSDWEIKIISDTVTALKASLRRQEQGD
jgi:transcriptional regulator with XRE-family HTH domain